MKKFLIPILLLFSTLAFGQTRFECINCERMSRDECSACEEYGATSEYFNGILVKQGRAITHIHKPFQVWTRGSTVTLQDWRGERVSVNLRETNFASMFDMLTYITACQCSGGGGNNGGDWVFSDGNGGFINVSPGDTLIFQSDSTLNVSINNNTVLYQVDTNILATQYYVNNMLSAGYKAIAPTASKNGGLIELSPDSIGFAPWQSPTDNLWAPDSRHFVYTTNYADSTLQKHFLSDIRGSNDVIRVFNGNGGSTVEYFADETVNMVECAGSAINGIIKIHLDTVNAKIAANTTRHLWVINNFAASNSVIEIYYKNVKIADFDDETSAAFCTYDKAFDNWTVSEFQNPDYSPPGATGGIYSGSGTVSAGAIADVPSGGLTFRYGNLSGATNYGMTITGGTNTEVSFDGIVQVEQFKIETSSGITPYLQIDSTAIPQDNTPAKLLTYDPITKRVYQSNQMDTSNFVKLTGEPDQLIKGNIQIGEKQKFYDDGFSIINVSGSTGNASIKQFTTYPPSPTGTFDVGDQVTLSGLTCGAVPNGTYTITQVVSADEFKINYNVPNFTICIENNGIAQIGINAPANLIVSDTTDLRGVVLTQLPITAPEITNTITYVTQDNGELKLKEKTVVGNTINISSETTSTVTASMYYVLPVDSSLGPVSINPPAAPSVGDWFAVSDSRAFAGTNPITIDFVTAAQNLHGASQNYIMNVDADFVKFIYIDSTVGWVSSK